MFRVLLIVPLALVLSGCGGSSDSNPASPTVTPNVAFTITDLRVGTGAAAQNGQTLTVHYTGWLFDASGPDNKGRMFDTSSGGAPFSFVLGTGQVIAGWDQGMLGMLVGGSRRLIIPPALGYGAAGAGGGVIPPDATLVFDVDLISVS